MTVAENDPALRVVFLFRDMSWPLRSGGDVNTFHLVKELASLACDVHILSTRPVQPEITSRLPKVHFHELREDRLPRTGKLSMRRQRFHRYWGTSIEQVEQVAANIALLKPHAVVAGSPDGPLYLAAIRDCLRVWHPNDDLFLHQLYLMPQSRWSCLTRLRNALIHALYERSMRQSIDLAWIVSRLDERAMRWVAGIGRTAVITSGVDSDAFPFIEEQGMSNSCMFWGRLDFAPNIDALRWFIKNVWPGLVERVPLASFRVCGMNPVPEVKALCRAPGVSLAEDVPSIRCELQKAQVAVFPLVSGAGIKTKVLEAASLGRPILCTPIAVNGLQGNPSLVIARTKGEWIEQLTHLWSDEARRNTMGLAIRQWVVANHSWRSAAVTARTSLIQSIS